MTTANNDKACRRTRKLAYVFMTAVIVVCLTELILSVLATVFPKVNIALSSPWDAAGKWPEVPRAIPDDQLGMRPNPKFPGHDRNGFRNQQVPTRAGIVVLGDSQTYGVPANDEATWPRQTEVILGETVYNMSLGGYGPAEYVMLIDEALALKPHTVVMAVYSGNDLYDAFKVVYKRGKLREFRSPDIEIRTAIEAAEKSESLKDKAQSLFPTGWAKSMAVESDSQATETGVMANSSDKTPAKADDRDYASDAIGNADGRRAGTLRFLAKRSNIYGLLRRISFSLNRRKEVTDEYPWDRVLRFAEINGERCEILESGDYRTVFTPPYRKAVLDLQDVRVREGLRISLDAMRKCDRIASTSKVRFIVAMIPTKELAFSGIVSSPSTAYTALLEAEVQVWSKIKEFLRDNDIEFVETLPALQAQIAAGEQPYPITDDGHPNMIGYKAIARTISEHIGNRTRVEQSNPRRLH